MAALAALCRMNPSQALAIRSKCVEYCRMPALAISLSLDHTGKTEGAELQGDMVAFVSGKSDRDVIKLNLICYQTVACHSRTK